MDWIRQVPIGQYVDGKNSWLRYLDPRLKFAWILMFLVTPVLAGPFWRVGLVLMLVLLTFFSSLPMRVWRKSFVLLLFFSCFLGVFSMFLPTSDQAALMSVRFPQEVPGLDLNGISWEVLRVGPVKVGPFDLGPLVIARRSAELGLNTATLIFTVIHSVNLMLITTPPEEIVWALSWFMAPLAVFGLPVDRISFQLLLALRFLPLVQEELQNLLRSLAIRAVNLRKLGIKGAIALLLAVGERLIGNILLRAEQGADAFVSRGGYFLPPVELRPLNYLSKTSKWLNIISAFLLCLLLFFRRKYGVL